MTATEPARTSAGPRHAARSKVPTTDAPVDRAPGSRRSGWSGWASAAAITVGVVGFSVLTVLRLAAQSLQADIILQSVMSVQDVTLFYWGQDRLASVVPFLASPIADPMTNLFACLFINALAFHTLLLILSRMGTFVVSGNRRWSSTLVLFLLMTAAAHTVIRSLFTMALDAQPYSMSWALALGAFLLWQRQRWWQFAVAATLVGIAVGLNPSVILVAGFLALIQLVRRRQWARWISFGVVWLVWFAIWLRLSAAFPGLPGPTPGNSHEYLSFSLQTFGTGAVRSVGTIYAALAPTRLVVLVVIACVATLLLSAPRRAALLQRLILTVLFATLYWTLFAGNQWVADNGFHFRYFFPVVLAVPVAIAAPIAAALLTVPLPLSARGANKALALTTAGLAVAASFVGPLTAPSQSEVISATKPTADYARANNVTFVAGSYWALWPVLLQTLEDGRTAAYGIGSRTDGDAAAYPAALDRALADPQSPPRAICVGQAVSTCLTFLDYWTRPGWREVAGNCPVPPRTPRLPLSQRTCKILEFPRR